jgi:hypothetical protein
MATTIPRTTRWQNESSDAVLWDLSIILRLNLLDKKCLGGRSTTYTGMLIASLLKEAKKRLKNRGCLGTVIYVYDITQTWGGGASSKSIASVGKSGNKRI